MKPETGAWVKAAEVDYRLAQRAAQTPAIPEGVCFHAQQCLEKYLKARLEEAGREAPRVHDLGTLHGMIADLPPDLSSYTADLKAIGTFAVAIRYPGAEALWDDLTEEATQSERIMTEVRAAIRLHLGLDKPIPQDNGPA